VADHAVVLDAGHAAHVDLLADGGDQRLGRVLDGAAAGIGGCLERVDIGGAGLQRDFGDGVAELQEARVLAHEVGFAVDLDQYGLAAGLVGDDAAFGGDAAGFLVGLGEAGLAQPLHGGVEVAVVLHQRLLAFHHAGGGRRPPPRRLLGGRAFVARATAAVATAVAARRGLARGSLAARAIDLGHRVAFLVQLDEVVAVALGGGRRGGLAFEDRVGGGAGIQLDRADRVVVARDGVVDQLR